MSSTETVDLTISSVETRSLAKIASKAARRIGEFADRHGVGHQYNEKRTEEDLIIFLAKRNVLHLEQLEVSILDDGSVGVGDTLSGRRLADLILRFHYTNEGRSM